MAQGGKLLLKNCVHFFFATAFATLWKPVSGEEMTNA
jgi:hypothetical protein